MIMIRYVGGPNDNLTVAQEEHPDEIVLSKYDYDYPEFTIEGLLGSNIMNKLGYLGTYRLVGVVEGDYVYVWGGWLRDE